MELAILVVIAFVAGFVDAIAGGGGLLQVPGLALVLEGAPTADVFGTNKGSSIAGTAIATLRYARAGALPLRAIAPAALASLPAAYGGAMAVRSVDPTVLRPVVLALLVGVFAFTLARPEIGTVPDGTPPLRPAVAARRSIALGIALGFYDGFFGPGTGTFLVFGFVRGLRMDFLRATGAAKLVNLATNLAALVLFGFHGNVRWDFAVPMAAANVCGAMLGTRLALREGAPLVRKAFLGLVVVLLSKIAYDLVRGS